MLLMNRFYAMEEHLNRFQMILLNSVFFKIENKNNRIYACKNYVEILCKPQN